MIVHYPDSLYSYVTSKVVCNIGGVAFSDHRKNASLTHLGDLFLLST